MRFCLHCFTKRRKSQQKVKKKPHCKQRGLAKAGAGGKSGFRLAHPEIMQIAEAGGANFAFVVFRQIVGGFRLVGRGEILGAQHSAVGQNEGVPDNEMFIGCWVTTETLPPSTFTSGA